MLVRKRKEIFSKKKEINNASDSEESLQSVRSWIRKIEQTTMSVSSRLSAVEKRLSGRISAADAMNMVGIEGPIETLLIHSKKKNIADIARVFDSELTLLHNELVKQQQETSVMKEQLGALEKTHTILSEELQAMGTMMTTMNTTLQVKVNQTENREPFMMHVGSLEIPVEFTGIIGGLLAFLIAFLVLINQKEILLSPWFLIPVGLLLIGFALIKMIHNRSRTQRPSFFTEPLKNPSAQLTLASFEKEEG